MWRYSRGTSGASILQRIAQGRAEVLPFLLPIFTKDGLFPRRIARALGEAGPTTPPAAGALGVYIEG